ncbi:MAG: hypothetical protein ACI965_001942 [Paraglaciecola sp.]|jgi:hypothetical protein
MDARTLGSISNILLATGVKIKLGSRNTIGMLWAETVVTFGSLIPNKVAVTGDISTISRSITLENHSTVAGDIVFESRNENTW